MSEAKPATAKKTRAEKQAPSPTPAVDELDAFALDSEWEDFIHMLFWKFRFDNAAASIEVTRADLKAFRECMTYLGVTPKIAVFRPEGSPATPGAPAQGDRRAIPPRPARPPKDYVVIQMVDQDGNAIVPIENNEQDFAKAKEAKRIKGIRDSATQLAAQLQADVQANAISNQTILQAAEALRVLAGR